MNRGQTRRGFLGSLATLGTATLAGCAGGENEEDNDDVIYQVSTIDALSGGSLDGVVSVGELERHGEVGLGTLSGADGEVVVVDGTTYVVRPEGEASRVPAEETTPFAVVTPFEDDRTVTLDGTVDFETLREQIDAELPTTDSFYAIKVEAEFDYIRTRTVPEQNPPYPMLEEVLDEEVVFEFEDVSGTMVGFRFPDSTAGVNVPGYHFHALVDDRTSGGHVYEFETTDPAVQLDVSSEFSMVLRESGQFEEPNGSPDG